MTRAFFFTLSCFISISTLIAQSSNKGLFFSPVFTYSKYAGDVQTTAAGFQMRFDYRFKKSGITLAIEKGFNSKSVSTQTSMNDYQDAEWSYKLNVDKIYLGYSYYLYREPKSRFNIYLLGGISYVLPNVVETNFQKYYYAPVPPSNSYNFSNTTINTRPLSSETPKDTNLATLDVGLGFVYRIGKLLSIFSDFKTSVPLSKEPLNAGVWVPLPAGVNLSNACYCTFKAANGFPNSYAINAGLQIKLSNANDAISKPD